MTHLTYRSHLPEPKPLLRGRTLWKATGPINIPLLKLCDELRELPDSWSVVGEVVWAGKPAHHREGKGDALGLQFPSPSVKWGGGVEEIQGAIKCFHVRRTFLLST